MYDARSRLEGLKGRKNVSGEDFNILTLEYLPTDKGDYLQYLVGQEKVLWKPATPRVKEYDTIHVNHYAV